MLLIPLLDGIKRGPKEIPFIHRGKGENVVLRILTSPEIQKGSYRIYLNCTYQDFLGKTYKESDSVTVYVGDIAFASKPDMAIFLNVMIVIMGLLALRRRLQSNRDH